jgi:hypothetical protein
MIYCFSDLTAHCIRQRRRARTLKPVGWLPFLGWFGLLFVQLISPDRAWSWLLVGLSIVLVVSYYWARLLRDHVTATRWAQGSWVVAGDELVERFTIANRARLPVLWARVLDHSAVPGYSADRVESVGSSQIVPGRAQASAGDAACSR